MSRTSATVMTGKASTIRIWVMKLIQVKIGMRIIVMPGARMLMMVTMKLNAAASEATPRIWRPMHPEVDVAARARTAREVSVA